MDQESRKRQRSSEEGGGRETVSTEITMGDPEKNMSMPLCQMEVGHVWG